MNLINKTPSNVRMSIKGNFPIEMSGVLLVFHNLMYSRFIRLVENFNPNAQHSAAGLFKYV